MKGAIAAGILLFVIIGLVIGNAVYVGHVTTRLSEMVEALPDEPTANTARDIRMISEYITQQKNKLSLSIVFSGIDRVLELCECLQAAATHGISSDYINIHITLGDAIKDMGRLEVLEWANIF